VAVHNRPRHHNHPNPTPGIQSIRTPIAAAAPAWFLAAVSWLPLFHGSLTQSLSGRHRLPKRQIHLLTGFCSLRCSAKYWHTPAGHLLGCKKQKLSLRSGFFANTVAGCSCALLLLFVSAACHILAMLLVPLAACALTCLEHWQPRQWWDSIICCRSSD
jgi:hypothetical protein